MDEMSDKLMTILQMVNDWLKFSEAKNAILLGFSGAGITTTAAFLSAAPSVPQSVQLGILITTFLLCVCSFICSLSFLPRTNLEMIVWRRSKPGKASKGVLSDSDNLYFFGHLYKYQASQLIDTINRLYLESKVQDISKKEYSDLASQIVVNSEITYLKYKIFSWAVYFLISSLFSTPICIIASLIIIRSI